MATSHDSCTAANILLLTCALDTSNVSYMNMIPDNCRSQISEARKRLQQLLREQQKANQEIEDLRALIRANANFLPDAERTREMTLLEFLKQPANITEAVRFTIFLASASGQKITPIGIKSAAETISFDFSEYSNPMASIHTILKRMREASPPQVDYDEESGSYWFGDLTSAFDVLNPSLFLETFGETMSAIAAGMDKGQITALGHSKAEETVNKRLKGIARKRVD